MSVTGVVVRVVVVSLSANSVHLTGGDISECHSHCQSVGGLGYTYKNLIIKFLTRMGRIA